MLAPVEAPIWAIGPSRPDVRPPPMVMAEVISLKIDVLKLSFSLLWNARIAAFVPIPAVCGANFQVRNPPTKPAAVVTRGSIQGRLM